MTFLEFYKNLRKDAKYHGRLNLHISDHGSQYIKYGSINVARYSCHKPKGGKSGALHHCKYYSNGKITKKDQGQILKQLSDPDELLKVFDPKGYQLQQEMNAIFDKYPWFKRA